MKKIIDSKMYNTETAELIQEWDNGIYGADFQRCSEELYRKKTGEFFLHGEGGPLTKYAVSYGAQNVGWGEIIIPFSEAEAKDWMETNGDADKYEEIFGTVEE